MRSRGETGKASSGGRSSQLGVLSLYPRHLDQNPVQGTEGGHHRPGWFHVEGWGEGGLEAQ